MDFSVPAVLGGFSQVETGPWYILGSINIYTYLALRKYQKKRCKKAGVSRLFPFWGTGQVTLLGIWSVWDVPLEAHHVTTIFM